jgi:TetR/AcrR family transcriptional repressor of nem operon
VPTARPLTGSFVPPEPPRTPKSARTRQRLEDAAWELFIDRGYFGVSMRDIGAAAGLTKTGAYGHYRSKGQLLVEVIRAKLAEADASIDFDEVNDLAQGARLMFDEHYRDIRILEVDAAAAARQDPDVAAGLVELYRQRVERMRDALAMTHDPESAAWLMSALIAGIGMKESVGLPQLDPDQLAATLTAIFEGLA